MGSAIRFGTTAVVSLGLAVAGFAAPAAGGEQLSKKEFLKEGNAICAQATEELDPLGEEIFGAFDEDTPPPPPAATAFVAGFSVIVRRALSQIDALEGPPALEKKVDKVLDEYASVVDDLEADPQLLFEDEDPFAKADKRARKVGLKECGSEDDEE